MKTIPAHNAQLTGTVELDPDYRRKIPIYDQTKDIEVLVQKLSEATGGSFDGCNCESCELLRLWRNLAIADRRKAIRELQDRIEAERIVKDDA